VLTNKPHNKKRHKSLKPFRLITQLKNKTTKKQRYKTIRIQKHQQNKQIPKKHGKKELFSA